MEKEELKQKNENIKNKKSKSKLIIKIIVIILVIVLVIFGSIATFVYSKLNKLKYQNLSNDVNIYKNDMTENEALDEDDIKGVTTFVLMGADGNDDESTNRSDTIMLFTINANKKTLSLITIPRDSFVYIPQLATWTKINGAYYHGGPEYLLSTINYNFGLNVDKYAAIDVQNLIYVIDYLGGVDVTITQAEMNYINNNQYIKALKYSGHQYKALSSYGNVTLNGDQALTHLRNRADENMDYGREKRNRDIIESLTKKISNLETSKILDFLDVVLPKITTNVNVAEYLPVIYDVLKNKNSYLKNITSVQVPNTSYCHDEYTWDGVWCLGIDFDKAKTDFIKYIYGVEE